MNSVVLAAALLLAISQVSSSRIPSPHSRPAGDGINFFSLQQDIELGADSTESVDKELPIVRDTHLNQYIRALGQRLVQGDSDPFHYQFRIVNSDEINSLGFPNGAVYVYRGLIGLTASDDEMAAVLAHEMGHIILRHPTSQLSRQLLVQAPISIASGLPTMDGWKDQLTKLGVTFGRNAPFLHYGRDQESEADLVAEQMLTSAHFDPHALDSVFEKIAQTGKKDDALLPAFLYNHPLSQPAKEDPRTEGVRPLNNDRPGRAGSEFRSFKSALLKLPKPVSGRKVSVAEEDAAVPNIFKHPLNWYQISYPEGWQVTQTLPNGAIIAPNDSVHASQSGDDLSFGVMFDIFDLSTSEHPLSLEQATNRLIIFLRQRNLTLRAVPGAQTPIMIHDEPGFRTVLLKGGLVRNGNSNVRESSEVAWLVTRMYYQNLFYMVFVAPEEEFPLHQPVFEQMIRSVQLR